MLAHTVLWKYGDYLPLYRQEDILSRHGIIIRRSTLCDWVASTADLLKPPYDLMSDRVRSSHVIHTDDTGVKMLAVGQCRNCKFWAYAGDVANPYAVYEFSLTREGKEPSRFLEGFEGYLQADAFSGYDQVYATGKVIEVACMAGHRPQVGRAATGGKRSKQIPDGLTKRAPTLVACTHRKHSSTRQSWRA